MRSTVAYALDRRRTQSLAPWARAQVHSISGTMHSIALTRANSFPCSIPPFKPHFHANDLRHTKTLKLTKTLENNKVKSLTNTS